MTRLAAETQAMPQVIQPALVLVVGMAIKLPRVQAGTLAVMQAVALAGPLAGPLARMLAEPPAKVLLRPQAGTPAMAQS
ncbi:hypothetical protein [Prauserella muralis]|uniref:Uncharacterized protein n=1 Tax=Prauserella muralis TaxID=588067 RepID=A0A2V4ACD8_9PSEU|nr:hypothetical protein [Prauserella muralis]PXY16555.1 hypothetical protein BAY60_35740 [Prauserella muralis]